MDAAISRYTRATSGLVKQLRAWDVFMLTLAAPTGSGILYYAVRTSAYSGGNISVAFAVGAMLFLPMLISSLVLVTAMPRSGGPYVGISRLVHPVVGFLAALLLVIGDSLVVGVLGVLVVSISGGMLSAVAQAFRIQRLLSLGGWLSGPTGTVAGGILWVALFWRLMLQNPRYFRWILRAFIFVPVLVSVIATGVFLTTDPASVRNSFDTLWGPNSWSQVVATATSAGWVERPFSWNATFGLLLIVVWAFNGLELASYAGGEVQAPRTSYTKGLMSGWLAVTGVYLITAFSVRHGFGAFVDAYDFLYSNHPALLEKIIPGVAPSIPFYLLCLVHNPALALLFGLAFVFWFAKIIPVVFLATSRLLFAVSMDRLLPEWVANVDPRTAAPTSATHMTAVLALGGSLAYFFKVSTVLGALMFCTMFIGWATGAAVMLLPYRMPELSPARWLLRPILFLPAACWLGGLTVISGLFLLFLTLRDLTSGGMLAIGGTVTMLVAYYMARSRRLGAEFARKAESPLPPE